jgi:hypothetical protein
MRRIVGKFGGNRPQRLKPTLFRNLIAAVNRCATQKSAAPGKAYRCATQKSAAPGKAYRCATQKSAAPGKAYRYPTRKSAASGKGVRLPPKGTLLRQPKAYPAQAKAYRLRHPNLSAVQEKSVASLFPTVFEQFL